MANEEMIRVLVKRIEAEPESWDQNSWAWTHDREMQPLPGGPVEWNGRILGEQLSSDFCNTTFCLAGHAIIHNGYIPLFDSREPHPTLQAQADTCLDPATGEIDTIENVATRLLDLDEEQAENLFHNYPDEVWELKELITEVTGITFED